MKQNPTINIALSANESHLEYAATTVASICRRTKAQVHARIFVRDAPLPDSFQSGNLTVEFIRPSYLHSGNIPGHIHPCVFDRMEIVEYAQDWDRCWLLDTDQLALNDIAELYHEDFEDNWMIAIAPGTNRDMCMPWFHHAWPEDAPAGDSLIPYLGALLNLQAMREGKFTDTFKRVNAQWGLNDQLCLSIAVDGRIKQASPSSNWLIWRYRTANSSARADLEWGRLKPHVVHWPTESKPWNDFRLWGAQLWTRELTSWNELRYELHFKDRDKRKIPAIVLHLARIGVRCDSLPDRLEDAGFGMELLRGCDHEFSFATRDSACLLLDFFGWDASRPSLARAISHRWAWQYFLEQTEEPYAVICEDGMVMLTTENEIRRLCESWDSEACYMDLRGPSPHTSNVDIAYCLNRKAAKALLDMDLTRTNSLLGPQNLPQVRVMRSTQPLILPAPVAESSMTGNSLVKGKANFSEKTFPGQILIGICSCHGNSEKRQAVRDSWFPHKEKNVDARFFVGRGNVEAEENDTIVLDAEDDYIHLPQKVLAFFRFALENFEFDWLFKCDDDTYVATDRLTDLADANYDFVGNHFLIEKGYASGGAGYLLKRAFIERLVASSDIPHVGDEDVLIGNAAIAHGAVSKPTAALCIDCSRLPRWDNTAVTCHWVAPAKMRAIRTIHRSIPQTLIEVEHSMWKDHVLLFDDGHFVRKSISDFGRWRWRESSSELILDWFDYPAELFLVSHDNKAFLSPLESNISSHP